jgi:3-hydroxybutyryl-CoA dehydrogenase
MTIERALVAGAGLMGHGIAQVLAGTGRAVTLYEPDLDRATAGRDRIGGNLDRSVGKGRMTAKDAAAVLDRIVASDDLEAAAADVDLVVEAVFEDVEVKSGLWSELDRCAPARAIFATNTSSISIDRLAAAVGQDRRTRFVGMHFFSPVPVMPLVELIRGSVTSDETQAAIRDLAADMGKQAIVSADRPGFIVNRILMPFLAEAMRAFSEGVGTADDIDTGARVGLNHPMGPLELADFIGLDVCLGIMGVLHDGFDEERFAPPAVLIERVEAGHLGQKTGRGFHVYPRQRRGEAGGP